MKEVESVQSTENRVRGRRSSAAQALPDLFPVSQWPEVQG